MEPNGLKLGFAASAAEKCQCALDYHDSSPSHKGGREAKLAAAKAKLAANRVPRPSWPPTAPANWRSAWPARQLLWPTAAAANRGTGTGRQRPSMQIPSDDRHAPIGPACNHER